MSGNVIDSHLANIINNDITKNVFSEKAKVASGRPIFKKNEREKIENYRSVSILNCFSKVYEKFLLEKFKPFINSFLSEYMAAYRKKYRTNHVLIRLIENWKKALNEKFLVEQFSWICQKRLIVFHTTYLLQNYTPTASV